jgi:aspartokinase/homoserine dehydrogenase 1
MDAKEVLVVHPTNKQQVDRNYQTSSERLGKWYEKHPSNTIIVIDFIGSMPKNIPTTLKHNGNDFLATIMGAFLLAKVTIWTNVDGVYNANPRKGTHCCFTRLNYHQVLQLFYTLKTWVNWQKPPFLFV